MTPNYQVELFDHPSELSVPTTPSEPSPPIDLFFDYDYGEINRFRLDDSDYGEIIRINHEQCEALNS